MWTRNDERFSSLTTSLGKKLILPTFRLVPSSALRRTSRKLGKIPSEVVKEPFNAVV